MSEWEKEKIRQSTLYIESEPDDNDLDEYYKYDLEEEKKKHEKHVDVDDLMALIFVITIVVGFILIVIGQLCGFNTLSIIGLILVFSNMIIGGLYFA